MSDFRLSIHIFRRDLRLDDNSGLLTALRKSEMVLPVFIFDEQQLTNPYFSNNAFQFMVHSLIELDKELRKKGSKLYCVKGESAHLVISEILNSVKADAVFVNRDYTPFSNERDRQISEVCKSMGVPFFSFSDALLTEPELVKKSDRTPYTVFTPFARTARLIPIRRPESNNLTNYFPADIPIKLSTCSPEEMVKITNPNILLEGGRREALTLVNEIGKLVHYEEERNIPSTRGTSLLSAHHKFGTLSIRETYHAIREQLSVEHPLINELYWRDFFTHIAFHFPNVFGNSFNSKYDRIEWSNNTENFQRWCEGQTGFPIVDAGMRELNETGFMHNRVRMVVASFLTKDLHVDWRWGEHYFANHLIDYDPSVNNGNWQWAASTGCDAQPYFRIFNPWSQQMKFDPDCLYIKKWIPELKELSAKEIHSGDKRRYTVKGYPEPMIDHKQEAAVSKLMFSKLKIE